MRKLCILVIVFTSFATQSQIISFPDPVLKTQLLQYGYAKNINQQNFYVDQNSDGEIDQLEALAVYYFVSQVPPNLLTDITGLEYFTNLKRLWLDGNPITFANLTTLVNLETFQCSSCELNTINVTGLSQLQALSIFDNHLQTIDVTGLTGLTDIRAYSNQLTSMDFSTCINLEYFSMGSLEYLNIKNGKVQQLDSDYTSFFSWNLRYLCVDDSELEMAMSELEEITFYNGTVQVNSYCSFVPGGEYFTIYGDTKLDMGNDGCTNDDIAFSAVRFNVSDGVNTGSFIPNGAGNYVIDVVQGNHTIVPNLENPAYFSITPASVNANFPSQGPDFEADFCLIPTGVHPDLEITILPINEVIPGFDSTYKIFYKNKGNTIMSGTVDFTFDNSRLNWISSQPIASSYASGLASWSFTNLLPFESRIITVTLNANTPAENPALNSGDVLSYSAIIAPGAGDEMPIDNQFILNQTVVNSLDPNDKTCLQGALVGPSMIGEYVHYIIRFENLGTASAQNVVVKDIIDTSKFDIGTLIPLSASHSFETRLSQSNKVEFIFQDINLPFDDANNDGHVAFKIKTQPNLLVGATFSNTASIYFDYNFPIITNTATTTISALATANFDNETFTIYPNPAKNQINIKTSSGVEVKSVKIYNLLGQLVLARTANQNNAIDVSTLKSGHYLIKVESEHGSATENFIKE